MSSTWLMSASLLSVGALDALEPGHGKLLIFSTLGGESRRWLDAILLGLLIAFTHFTVNGLLVVAFSLLLQTTQAQHQVTQIIEVVAGLAMIAFGIYLIVQKWSSSKRTLSASSHTALRPQVPQRLPAEPCNHPAAPHQAQPCNHLFHLPTLSSAQFEHRRGSPSFQRLVFLAVISGLMPCPLVLATLVSSASIFPNIWETLQAITLLSIGYGGVMMVLALASISGSHWLDRLANTPEKSQQLKLWMTLISAAIAVLLGILVLLHAFAILPAMTTVPLHLHN